MKICVYSDNQRRDNANGTKSRIVWHVNLYFRKYFQRTTMQSNSKQQGQRSQRAGRSGVRIPVGAKYFSLLQIVRTGCGTHLATYLTDTAVLSPG